MFEQALPIYLELSKMFKKRPRVHLFSVRAKELQARSPVRDRVPTDGQKVIKTWPKNLNQRLSQKIELFQRSTDRKKRKRLLDQVNQLKMLRKGKVLVS